MENALITEINTSKSSYSLKEIKEMADCVCASGLFSGITTREAAVSLMMLCQAENIHPIKAVQRYHIIKGKPTMKADSMLGEFQNKGGKVKWIRWDDEVCEAIFFAPGVVDGIKVDWSIERAHRANLTSNPTWKSYPRNMLRARVISDGIRMCMPSIIAGIYTPEEVSEFDDIKINKNKLIDVRYSNVNEEYAIEIIENINNCKSLEELNEIGEIIKTYSLEIRNYLRKYYAEKFKTLKEIQDEISTDE